MSGQIIRVAKQRASRPVVEAGDFLVKMCLMPSGPDKGKHMIVAFASAHAARSYVLRISRGCM